MKSKKIGKIYAFYRRLFNKLFPFAPLFHYEIESRNYKRTLSILSENANVRSANFIEQNIEFALIHNWDYEIQEWAAKEIKHKISEKYYCLEFGVWYGRSINRMSVIANNHLFFGFDTFTGLPFDWFGTNLNFGALSEAGLTPKVNKNVKLITGLFADSLKPFLSNLDSENMIGFIHIDCDLYESTKDVLELILPQANLYPENGILILFDEFIGYPGFEEGEFKAFFEIVEKYKIKYKFVGFSNQQAAVIVKNI
jgi:hypothetical protein